MQTPLRGGAFGDGLRECIEPQVTLFLSSRNHLKVMAMNGQTERKRKLHGWISAWRKLDIGQWEPVAGLIRVCFACFEHENKIGVKHATIVPGRKRGCERSQLRVVI